MDDHHFSLSQRHSVYGSMQAGCLRSQGDDDEQLDLRPPGGDRTVREIVEHVLATLTGYFPDQVANIRKQKN